MKTTAVLLVISALLILRATLIQVRDNIDVFMGDLNRQSRWAIAVTASILDALRQFGWLNWP